MTKTFPPSATQYQQLNGCVTYMKFGTEFNLKNRSAGLSFLTNFTVPDIIDVISQRKCVSLLCYLLFYQGELRHIFPQKVVKFRKIRCS